MLAALLVLLAASSPVEQAERLAEAAIAEVAAQPAGALDKARRALALTVEFEPVAFVDAGRKGEVVEDAYLAARREYRRHRARLYRANGLAHAAAGRGVEAVRYLERATLLDPSGPARADLALALTGLGRGSEALAVALAGDLGALDARQLEAGEAAVEALGLPSLQVELDRARSLAATVKPPLQFRDGPFRLTGRERLSTGAPLGLDGEDLTVFYVADAACRSCSADLEALRRVVPETVRIVVAPAGPEQDEVVRRALRVYRYDWPVAVGPSLGRTLELPAPSAFVAGRRGFAALVVRPPLLANLPAALEILARHDLRETIPRPSWHRRPIARSTPPAAPALLAEGLAPGEDEPAPQAFAEAVSAYREGRYRDALRLFEELEKRGDGWLLPPEARLNRALCLARLGRREDARKLLLKTGDSRFQEAVDRSLEEVAAGR